MNAQERNHRVQMMQQVHNNARSALVWLDADEDGDVAISRWAPCRSGTGMTEKPALSSHSARTATGAEFGFSKRSS
jgi:hypothetical protein